MTDRHFPDWIERLFDAGRELATLIEEDIQACGNAPPHDREHCDDCRPQREALTKWMVAVVGARKAAQP